MFDRYSGAESKSFKAFFVDILGPLESWCSECCLHIIDITEIVRKFYKRQLEC